MMMKAIDGSRRTHLRKITAPPARGGEVQVGDRARPSADGKADSVKGWGSHAATGPRQEEKSRPGRPEERGGHVAARPWRCGQKDLGGQRGGAVVWPPRFGWPRSRPDLGSQRGGRPCGRPSLARNGRPPPGGIRPPRFGRLEGGAAVWPPTPCGPPPISVRPRFSRKPCVLDRNHLRDGVGARCAIDA
ncbi:hypothetical protein KSP40_PGU019392 [Platanthera guangdongensis]|uniref:Uncharacterized protein n=1 Tax=Platanthera guangdongensis TaxID=2320717 RepID=A0ABR2N0S0_9ASPA